MFTFDQTETADIEAKINLPGGSFTLSLKPPTLEEVAVNDALVVEYLTSQGAQHTDAYRRRFMAQLKHVTDWQGINGPDGKPIPFSRETLEKLLVKYPAAVNQLRDKLADLYAGTEDQKKELGESDAKQDASPADTEPQTQPSLSIYSGEESTDSPGQ